MSSSPDTLKVCEACGADDMADECGWCTDGYQGSEQRVNWRRFRKGMRKISGTYNFLEAAVRDVLRRLSDLDEDFADMLAAEGDLLLQEWEEADPSNGGRTEASGKLLEFNGRALDHLTKK